MPDKSFILDLGKLMIAAAWADGELTNEEINSLKEVLFGLKDISGDDWKKLEMYMESPVSEQERQILLDRLLNQIRSPEDKKLIINKLQQLFHSDGEISTEEAALLNEIENTVSKIGTDIFSQFSKALKSTISKRSSAVQSSTLRENDFEDYIKNTVYYDLQQKQKESGMTIDLAEEKLRKLCLATGLLSFVAGVDSEISDQEKKVMRDIITGDWQLSAALADLLIQISSERAVKGLDFYRISYNFFNRTRLKERKDFIKTLFKIANATDKTSREEIEEIRRIAQALKVSHQDFIKAKLTISREDRDGF
ncbi:MAG: TerB family tellurite resistance protein [bacterium]